MFLKFLQAVELFLLMYVIGVGVRFGWDAAPRIKANWGKFLRDFFHRRR